MKSLKRRRQLVRLDGCGVNRPQQVALSWGVKRVGWGSGHLNLRWLSWSDNWHTWREVTVRGVGQRGVIGVGSGGSKVGGQTGLHLSVGSFKYLLGVKCHISMSYHR